jgi:hypothetical protein
MSKFDVESIIGFKYKSFTVIQLDKIVKRTRGSGNDYYYKCLCDCGFVSVRDKNQLLFSSRNNIDIVCSNCRDKNRQIKNEKPQNKPEIDRKFLKVLADYKHSAKRRNIYFDLKLEDFKNNCLNDCHYCGIAPNKNRKKRNNKGFMAINFNGLDRIDNKKGYVSDNIVPCCSDCNLAKRDLSTKAFLEMITLIYNNKVKTQ